MKTDKLIVTDTAFRLWRFRYHPPFYPSIPTEPLLHLGQKTLMIPMLPHPNIRCSPSRNNSMSQAATKDQVYEETFYPS